MHLMIRIIIILILIKIIIIIAINGIPIFTLLSLLVSIILIFPVQHPIHFACALTKKSNSPCWLKMTSAELSMSSDFFFFFF